MLDDTLANARRSEAARVSYNRLSRWYDLLATGLVKGFREDGLRLLAAGENEKVLEIGFGTGHCVVALAKAVGTSGKVYGIDISDGMLHIANKRIRKAGFEERVHLERGDAVQLPFKEEFFDAVFMSFTLELFDAKDILAILGRCYMVLRPGGRICVAALSNSEQPGFMVRFYLWAHHRFPGFIDCHPIYVQAVLKETGFLIERSGTRKLKGLPVDIVLARKSGDIPAKAGPRDEELQAAV